MCRSLELFQRGDLVLKVRGNLLDLFGSLRLGLSQVFPGGLLGGDGLALFGLDELLLSLLDLDVHFLCCRRELLQRRFAENLLAICQGQGGKIGNGLFYFCNGCRIRRRMEGNRWTGRLVGIDGPFSRFTDR